MESEIEEAGAGQSLEAYYHILRRRWLVILQTAIVIGVVGTIVTLLTKPVYESRARLLVEPPSMGVNSIDPSNPLSSILTLTPTQDVATQVAELQAQPLLRQVQTHTGPATFTVQQEGATDVIAVVVQANSPNVATNAANTLLQAYLNENADNSLNEIRSARQFSHDRAVAAHMNLMRADAQIRQLKQKDQVSDFNADVAALQARTGALYGRIESGQASLNSIQSQIAADRRILAHEPEGSYSTLKVNNPDVATIQAAILQLQLNRVAMTQKGGYTSSAPPIVAIDAQIAEYKRRLANMPATTATVTGQANPVRDQLRSDLAKLTSQEVATQADINSIRQALGTAKAEMAKTPSWEVTFAKLMQEHDAARTDYKMFSDKEADLALREQAYHATAHILEAAQGATLVRPKKGQNILFSVMIGLFLGLCLAILQEMLDDRINSVEESGRLLSQPSLGVIPLVADLDSHLLTGMGGKEPAAESYRTLRTNIHFASVDSPVETLLVTSAHAREGKTMTATNIALAMALDGKSVILVDTDLRRSSVHKNLGLTQVPGVTDVLFGHVSLDEALQTVEATQNLRVLTGGSVPPNPSEILNSWSFSGMVQKLVAKADIVIFDSPPVLVGADAAILASQMSATLLVVAVGETKKHTAKHAISMLAQARAKIIGVVYNKTTASAGYGYYYYERYYYSLPSEQDEEGGRKHRRRIHLPLPGDSTLPVRPKKDGEGGDEKTG